MEIRRENFYRIETTPDGIRFATARGWEDLSEMIGVCETLGVEVGQELILQYIQNPGIAKDFANYYELYNKYRTDYRVGEVLEGRFSDEAVTKLRLAPFDEKLSVIGLLLSKLSESCKGAYRTDRLTESLFAELKDWKQLLPDEKDTPDSSLLQLARKAEELLALQRENGQIGGEEEDVAHRCIRALESYAEALRLSGKRGADEAFAFVKERFGENRKTEG